MAYYSAFVGNSLPTFRDNITVPSAGVKNPSLDNLNIEDGTAGLYRNVGKELPTITRCVISQKGADLVSFAAEA